MRSDPGRLRHGLAYAWELRLAFVAKLANAAAWQGFVALRPQHARVHARLELLGHRQARPLGEAVDLGLERVQARGGARLEVQGDLQPGLAAWARAELLAHLRQAPLNGVEPRQVADADTQSYRKVFSHRHRLQLQELSRWHREDRLLRQCLVEAHSRQQRQQVLPQLLRLGRLQGQGCFQRGKTLGQALHGGELGLGVRGGGHAFLLVELKRLNKSC
jgi:hypothetical protein